MIKINYQNKQDQFLQKSCKVYNQSIPSQCQNYLKINKEKEDEDTDEGQRKEG